MNYLEKLSTIFELVNPIQKKVDQSKERSAADEKGDEVEKDFINKQTFDYKKFKGDQKEKAEALRTKQSSSD